MKTVRGIAAAREALLDLRRFEHSDPHRSAEEAVSRILEQVRTSGDAALRKLTLDLDGLEVAEIEVPRAAVEDAYHRVPAELVDALKTAAGRIRRFHEATLPKNWMDEFEGYGEVFNCRREGRGVRSGRECALPIHSAHDRHPSTRGRRR